MQLRLIKAVLVLAPWCALAGDRMTIHNGRWQKHGVTLVPATEYASLSQLVHLKAAAAVKDFAPVSFVLQNRSGRAVHAYTATWTYTPPSGKARKHIWTEWRFSNPLVHGGDAFIAPAPNLGEYAGPNEESLASMRRKFLPQDGVTVVMELSAVLFDDGGALGSSADMLSATATAHLNAIRDLARDLAAAPDLGAATVLLEAKAAPRNQLTGAPIRLTRRAQPIMPTERAAIYYADQQQSLSRAALAMLRKHGLDYARDMVAAEAGALPSYNPSSREEAAQ